MPLNTDPFAPWNDALHKDDPFAPHNDPMRKDDPFEPWNDPFGSEYDLGCKDLKAYGIRPTYKHRKCQLDREDW